MVQLLCDLPSTCYTADLTVTTTVATVQLVNCGGFWGTAAVATSSVKFSSLVDGLLKILRDRSNSSEWGELIYFCEILVDEQTAAEICKMSWSPVIMCMATMAIGLLMLSLQSLTVISDLVVVVGLGYAACWSHRRGSSLSRLVVCT